MQRGEWVSLPSRLISALRSPTVCGPQENPKTYEGLNFKCTMCSVQDLNDTSLKHLQLTWTESICDTILYDVEMAAHVLTVLSAFYLRHTFCKALVLLWFQLQMNRPLAQFHANTFQYCNPFRRITFERSVILHRAVTKIYAFQYFNANDKSEAYGELVVLPSY